MYVLGEMTLLSMERTASRAVRDAFLALGGKQVAPHHEGPQQGHEVVGVPVTVVRNHWDIVVSHWYNAKMNERADPPISYRWLAYHFMQNRALFPAGGMYRFLEVPGIHVLRYETLQDDLDGLLLAHGYEPIALEWVGESEERQRRHYREYYNDLSAAFVGWAFRPEILALGYRFEGPPGG